MGLLNFVMKFIPNYAAVAATLHDLLKKGVESVWTDSHQIAFDELKSLLFQSPLLSFPNSKEQFRLSVDASYKGLGYMVYQIYQDGSKHVVRFGLKGSNR